jgi:hypothetical protein
MSTLYNLQQQPLLALNGVALKNFHDDILAHVEGDTLIDLRQQRLANVADGAVFLNGERAVAHIDDGFVVNAFDQKLARIEGGNEREQALIAAGFMLFYAGSS